MSTSISKQITSYDLLKAVAVIIMIVDHTGHYFYPDEMWFRVIGRLCVPIWFFLIGYARTSEITDNIKIGILVLMISAVVAGQFIFPLSILVTIAFARHYRPQYIRAALYSPESLRGVFLIMIFAALPSGILFEYGTMALLFVIFGYMVRNWDEAAARIRPAYLHMYVGASFFVFALQQAVSLPTLTLDQGGVLLLGLAGVAGALYRFKSREYVVATQRLPAVLTGFVQIMGRRTLEIYVAHLVVFRGVAMYLDPARYPFLEWKLVAGNIIAPFF
jgi:TraX protein